MHPRCDSPSCYICKERRIHVDPRGTLWARMEYYQRTLAERSTRFVKRAPLGMMLTRADGFRMVK